MKGWKLLTFIVGYVLGGILVAWGLFLTVWFLFRGVDDEWGAVACFIVMGALSILVTRAFRKAQFQVEADRLNHL
jgi:hypothetical protein